jgi:hypothetical protein
VEGGEGVSAIVLHVVALRSQEAVTAQWFDRLHTNPPLLFTGTFRVHGLPPVPPSPGFVLTATDAQDARVWGANSLVQHDGMFYLVTESFEDICNMLDARRSL